MNSISMLTILYLFFELYFILIALHFQVFSFLLLLPSILLIYYVFVHFTIVQLFLQKLGIAFLFLCIPFLVFQKLFPSLLSFLLLIKSFYRVFLFLLFIIEANFSYLALLIAYFVPIVEYIIMSNSYNLLSPSSTDHGSIVSFYLS